jgi:hypothetical protein
VRVEEYADRTLRCSPAMADVTEVGNPNLLEEIGARPMASMPSSWHLDRRRILATLLAFAVLVTVLPGAAPTASAATGSKDELASAYRYYQFDVTKVRSDRWANGVQMSEFAVLDGSRRLPAVAATALIEDSPSRERAENVIDGVTSTKWFSPSKTDNAVIIDMGSPVAIDGYQWATANDTVNRDPRSWQVSGSNDGMTFTLLDEQIDYPTTQAREAWVGRFDVVLGSAPVEDPEAPTEPEAPSDAPEAPADSGPVTDGERLLYSEAEIAEYVSRMSGAGPYYSAGDVSPNSPGDGARAVKRANTFLQNPSASYWVQPVPMVPTTSGPIEPHGEENQRFLQAAWVYMTEAAAVPEADRVAMRNEVKKLLLATAQHSNHDYWDASKWDVRYPGSATNPFFSHAEWMVRLMKARDMLGRDAFTEAENQIWDQWLHGYANYVFRWFHTEATNISSKNDNRLSRDYSTPGARYFEDSSEGFDGSGPRMRGAGDYTNRHATILMAASLAANYIKHFDYVPGKLPAVPSYGVWTVDQLVDQSRLFSEELLIASWYPVGMQHDFGRGSSGSPTVGWSYSINVVNTAMMSALYHAKRGDMSLWEFGTTAGFRSSAGSPAANGGGASFPVKNLHHMSWAMVRYVNDAWGRRLAGQEMVSSNTYHDVLPAALASRFAPEDTTLAAGWRRQGQNFPMYPSSPQSQGPWHAHDGQGAQWVGLIEHGAMPPLR